MAKSNPQMEEARPLPAFAAMPRVERTSAGLRHALFDEIDRIRNGETDAKKANAVARLASEVVNVVTMELEVQKYLAGLPAGSDTTPLQLMRPIQLAS